MIAFCKHILRSSIDYSASVFEYIKTGVWASPKVIASAKVERARRAIEFSWLVDRYHMAEPRHPVDWWISGDMWVGHDFAFVIGFDIDKDYEVVAFVCPVEKGVPVLEPRRLLRQWAERKQMAWPKPIPDGIVGDAYVAMELSIYREISGILESAIDEISVFNK